MVEAPDSTMGSSCSLLRLEQSWAHELWSQASGKHGQTHDTSNVQKRRRRGFPVERSKAQLAPGA